MSQTTPLEVCSTVVTLSAAASTPPPTLSPLPLRPQQQDTGYIGDLPKSRSSPSTDASKKAKKTSKKGDRRPQAVKEGRRSRRRSVFSEEWVTRPKNDSATENISSWEIGLTIVSLALSVHSEVLGKIRAVLLQSSNSVITGTLVFLLSTMVFLCAYACTASKATPLRTSQRTYMVTRGWKLCVMPSVFLTIGLFWQLSAQPMLSIWQIVLLGLSEGAFKGFWGAIMHRSQYTFYECAGIVLMTLSVCLVYLYTCLADVPNVLNVLVFIAGTMCKGGVTASVAAVFRDWFDFAETQRPSRARALPLVVRRTCFSPVTISEVSVTPSAGSIDRFSLYDISENTSSLCTSTASAAVPTEGLNVLLVGLVIHMQILFLGLPSVLVFGLFKCGSFSDFFEGLFSVGDLTLSGWLYVSVSIACIAGATVIWLLANMISTSTTDSSEAVVATKAWFVWGQIFSGFGAIGISALPLPYVGSNVIGWAGLGCFALSCFGNMLLSSGNKVKDQLLSIGAQSRPSVCCFPLLGRTERRPAMEVVHIV